MRLSKVIRLALPVDANISLDPGKANVHRFAWPVTLINGASSCQLFCSSSWCYYWSARYLHGHTVQLGLLPERGLGISGRYCPDLGIDGSSLAQQWRERLVELSP